MHGVIFQLDQTEENCFCAENDEGLMQHRGNNLFNIKLRDAELKSDREKSPDV